MAQVQLEHISKVFGEGADATTAVDDVSLTIDDHEFMILLGPSGCGKSTLLRMVAGLEDPTSGDLLIDGLRVNDVEPKLRDVAMVFQSYALYPHKTVQRNIEFPLKVRGVSKAERAKEAERAAEVLGLTDYLRRKPGQLSGGQRQRVALARAIVRRPAVFLMDEPLSNLDAKLRGDTRAELVDLHRRLNSTFIYVTHDQVEAMTMGTRVAVINKGRIEQVGSPQEVYDAPASTFVAQFIGTPPMNLLPPGMIGASDVQIGVRPEHLRVDPSGTITGSVRQLEHLGHEVLLLAEGDGGLHLTARIAPHDQVPGVGDVVRFTADERFLHRFDAATGVRLP
ncbi:MAG TPA: sn-glycerol-3-phosphate ABC transporter ATP-binding protein UgpC [Acidimicrobiaceae bacterium]|nr:sn-glycerol-3-phosphate ABC transporter ATP-binding protein UgpC [Acidimicrobiaceae bacterium]